MRLALLVLFLGATAVVLASGAVPTSADEVRAAVEAFGALGPAGFVVIAICLSCLHLPPPLLSAAAGFLFGLALGAPLALVAISGAACAQLLIGRLIIGEAARDVLPERVRRLDRFLEQHGVLAVLYVRLIPGVPFADLNYAAGLTSLRPRAVAVGTAAGSAPKTFAYVALGGSFADPSAPETWIAIGLLVFTALSGVFLARHQLRIPSRGDRRRPALRGMREASA